MVLFLLCDFFFFNFQERQRKYQSLSPWDKATLSLVNPTAEIYLLQLVNLHNGSCSYLAWNSAYITTTPLALLDPWEEFSGQKYQIHSELFGRMHLKSNNNLPWCALPVQPFPQGKLSLLGGWVNLLHTF